LIRFTRRVVSGKFRFHEGFLLRIPGKGKRSVNVFQHALGGIDRVLKRDATLRELIRRQARRICFNIRLLLSQLIKKMRRPVARLLQEI
jgi:hypothetical protein